MAIKQIGVSNIKSRKDCKVTYPNGSLPLITAPMSCVADIDNYTVFTNLGISVCLPRSANRYIKDNLIWNSWSLKDFETSYLDKDYAINTIEFACIDVANGNMWKLHNVIARAKQKYGDSLVIMSGNVASVEAFIELAKTGCDYIRVGIGGSSVCSTYLNTGVGYDKPLDDLILKCYEAKIVNKFSTKIVADGISSYVDYLVTKKRGLPNGYAAINRLLYNGANYVMVGTLFAQFLESAAEKYITNDNPDSLTVEEYWSEYGSDVNCVISGMSTRSEQNGYKDSNSIRHSEGFVKDTPVKYSLKDWLHGSKDQDTSGLSGFIPNLQSAMSYCGVDSIENFITKV
jgi:hypothetical protein